MAGRDARQDLKADSASSGARSGLGRGRVLEAINSLQSSVISGDFDLAAAFTRALDVLLEVTGAPGGFIGEVVRDTVGAPSLKPLASTGPDWSAASPPVAALARRHGLELAGTGAPSSETPAPQVEAEGLGLPLIYGGEMIGLVGLGGVEGGHPPGLADDLAPLTIALAAIMVAERAKADRDLQAERAELALTGSDAAVWDWNIATDTLWWSPSLKAMLGLPDTTEPDLELYRSRLHPDDAATVMPAIEAALEGREPYRRVFRLAREDGGYATIRSTGQVIRDADGAPLRMVGVQIDISREIALESQAREAGEFSGVALAAAGLAAWRWEGETDLITLDARFAALLDWPELEGRPLTREDVLSAVHPDDQTLVQQELDMVFENRTHTFRTDHRLLTATGRTIWVRGHAGVLEQPDGAAPIAAGVVVDRTEAKRTELALAEAKERYELAVNGSGIAIWDWNIETDELVWSDHLFCMLGLTRDDVTGRTNDFNDRMHPEDRSRAEAALTSHVEAGAAYDIQFRMRHSSGRWVPIHSRGASVRDASGRAVRMVGSALDLTAEQDAELSATEAMAKISLAARHAGIFPLEIDMVAEVMRGDESLVELLGEPGVRELDLQHAMAFVHREDRAALGARLLRMTESGADRFESEHRVIRADGSTLWTETVAVVTRRDEHGAPTLLSGVIIDHTARRMAERGLAQAKERYDLAVNGSHIAIWDWNIENDELVCSDEMFIMLGLTPVDYYGRRTFFNERLHPEDRARVEAGLNDHRETGATYDLKFRLRHSSGRWVPVHSRGASVRDASGSAVRMVGSLQDLTKEQNAERTAAEAMAQISLAARHAGIGPVEMDLTSKTLRGDENFARLVGLPDLREVTFKQARSFIHQDDRAKVDARILQLIESGGDRFESEHRLVHPNGSTLWTETVAVVTRRDENGAPTLLSGVIVDHTARKEVERDLARANERYDLAVGVAHMAIWDQNLITGEVYWSARMGEILGLGPEEGHEDAETFTARIHPGDREETGRAFRALVNDDAPYDQIIRLRRADGGYATVRSRGGILRDESGAAVRVCGSLSDISGEVIAGARADIALEAAQLGIWDWDLASGVMTADSRFAEILGRPWLADQPGSTAQRLRYIHDDDWAIAEAKVLDLEAGRIDRTEFEHRVVRPDGSIAWVGGGISVIESGADGKPRRIIGVFEDRTERKAAEMELAESKQRYDLAVSGALTAIWDQNLKTGELYWSARLGEMLGLGAVERTEMLGDFLERIHPDDRERAREATQITLQTGAPLNILMRVRHADGGYRHLRSRAGVLRDAMGRPLRLCGSANDVTEEIEAEAKARLSGRRAQLALEAAHLGVWEFDAETNTVIVDATLADLLGAPDLAGKARPNTDIQRAAHPDDLPRVNADLARLYKGELSSVRNEHRIVRPDGEEVWVRADVGVAERSADGSIARLIGIVQDLSGIKATEALLRKSAEAAGKANEAKSQFLATMSHEIRTPLNGVLGVVQLLERTDLDARQTRYVETIKASGRSLSEVIEDVLDISRIEAGKLRLKSEPTLVSDILEQAAAPSRALAAEKGVELTLSVSGALSRPVYVDPRRVGQMTANLIGNAVKFTESGGVRVTAMRPERGVLRIEVDDDGPGLAEDMHDAVFERFTQADMSASRPHQGSGLGLAIVHELAKLAGGVAGVRSRPGEGACFWIEIPAPAAAQAVPEPRGAARDAGPVAASRRLRVLVVEDHPVNRAVTAEIVTQAGHGCETAESGEEALSALSARPVDVVLLDLHMPGMDGRETLARIRGGEAGSPDLPVYIVSADATPEASEETRALGADGFFVKPLDADALLRTLGALARRSREVG